jgi:hypothetical protein
MGHGGGHREPLQRPVMMVARFTAQSPRTRLAFERSFPAITLDVHLQDGGMVHEPVDGCQRHGLDGENLAPFAEGMVGRDRAQDAHHGGQLHRSVGASVARTQRRYPQKWKLPKPIAVLLEANVIGS